MTPESFDSRKKLPTPWRGVRDAALSELVGVEGAIFVHASGFIGGHQTKEGALSMAIQVCCPLSLSSFSSFLIIVMVE
jgi:uncharacterized UPF0160 family protein